jgi:DNA invertase Pin-like site-specific DNA recombinase
MIVFDVYAEAFTGKKTDRPKFNQAIQQAIENKVNYFVIFDIDRFSREGY